MILKTLMEEKQLDFNQPLLSVRRISSTAASENDYKRKPDKPVPKRPPLPFYKSELKSGPVTNPGTVPFVWEKTPGRPKNESKQQTQAVERPSVAPKLPPGRVLKVEQQDSDKVPKGASVTQSRTGSSVSDSPRTASLDNKVTKHEIPQVIEEKASSVSNDEDENYLDALDTLSRTESFFMSCSVSGLSEWDGPDVQPSGNFSTDQQTRDFMIGRFLPAAKAMASETPQIQHNSRKSLVTQEQLKQARKVESGANSRPLNPKWQKVLPHYAQDIGREESEDESDDHDGYENYAPKVCGLFPRFCLLNPVPGLRMEGRIPSSTVHGVQGKSITSHRRTAKEHGRTATYGKKSVNSQSGYTEERDFLSTAEKSKHDIDPHRRACSKSLASERTEFESSCESPVIEKTLYVDSVHKVKTSISCSSDTNLRGDDFDTLRKDTDLDKNLSIDFSIEDSKHLGIVDEKAVSEPEISASLDSSLLVCSDNSNDNMQMEMKNHSNKICPEKQELTKPDYQGSNLDHDLVAISSPEMVAWEKIESESKGFSSKESSNGLIKNPIAWRNRKFASDLKFDSMCQQATKLVDQECTLRSSEDPRTLASSKVVGDRKINLESQLQMKLGHGKTSNASSLKLPLALPSPKAPSESWLKRTLPTVSSKNISLRLNLATHYHAPTQTPKTALPDPKWERIVKSSEVNHGHLQFAQVI
ncbi:hypothetical protein GLYMA_12G128800v4 [Glycine max]|uniref:DUF688 domain-containing protein n=1 Tax=Glycine soja TaxID=3848 RepID=A0A445HPC9_GLYSO|nr:hypothetical protein GLYMA_12G128800v4 [Glycine max]KAH1142916.1 hypothetical protein GYH30_033572 [Glycine max]RZB75611.1 hypothetical protein D0Y65_034195 [Glycine soja]